MEYIRENLKKILDPNEVVAFRPVRDNGYYMAAFKKDGTILPLTRKESSLTFPFSPASCLNGGVGVLYMDEFVLVYNDYIALNKQVSNVYAKPCKDGKNADVMVSLDDGKPVSLYITKKARAEKDAEKIKATLEAARNKESDEEKVM